MSASPYRVRALTEAVLEGRRIRMSDETFRISKDQVGVVLAWLGYINQARIALELENAAGHEALRDALQKAASAILRVMSDLPPV